MRRPFTVVEIFVSCFLYNKKLHLTLLFLLFRENVFKMYKLSCLYKKVGNVVFFLKFKVYEIFIVTSREKIKINGSTLFQYLVYFI